MKAAAIALDQFDGFGTTVTFGTLRAHYAGSSTWLIMYSMVGYQSMLIKASGALTALFEFIGICSMIAFIYTAATRQQVQPVMDADPSQMQTEGGDPALAPPTEGSMPSDSTCGMGTFAQPYLPIDLQLVRCARLASGMLLCDMGVLLMWALGGHMAIYESSSRSVLGYSWFILIACTIVDSVLRYIVQSGLSRYGVSAMEGMNTNAMSGMCMNGLGMSGMGMGGGGAGGGGGGSIPYAAYAHMAHDMLMLQTQQQMIRIMLMQQLPQTQQMLLAQQQLPSTPGYAPLTTGTTKQIAGMQQMQGQGQGQGQYQSLPQPQPQQQQYQPQPQQHFVRRVTLPGLQSLPSATPAPSTPSYGQSSPYTPDAYATRNASARPSITAAAALTYESRASDARLSVIGGAPNVYLHAMPSLAMR
jgi:hypothetical protein